MKYFNFLMNEKSEFYVYSNKIPSNLINENDDDLSEFEKVDNIENVKILNQICHPYQEIYNYKWIFGIISFLIVFIDLLFFFFVDFKLIKQSKFWIITKSYKVLYGKPLDTIDRASLYYLRTHIKHAFIQKKTVTTVIRLKRKTNRHVFERIIVFPMSENLAFAIIWDESLSPSDEINFDCTFESEHLNVLEKPKITFSSFRYYRPIHVSWTLDNNVRCVADLPASILAPFQPYGQVITLTLSIFNEMLQEINNPDFSSQSFHDTMKKFCEKAQIVKRGLFYYHNNRLTTQFCREGLNELNTEVTDEIFYKCSQIHGWKIIDNFYSDNDRCFVSKISSSITVFEIDSPLTDIFEELGLPFLTLSSLFLYNITVAFESNFVFHEFMKLFTKTNKFSFIQIGLNSYKMILCDSPIFDHIDTPKTLEQLLGFLGKADTSELDRIVEETREIMRKGGGFFKTREIKLWVNRPLWFKVSGIIIYDDTVNENVASFLAEDITSKKQQELENFGQFEYITKAMKGLNAHKFKIEDNEVIMENDDLFNELGYSSNLQQINNNNTNENEYSDSNHWTLLDIIDKRDLNKYQLLLTGKKVSLRLVNNNNVSLWYSLASNGNIGFLFSINSFNIIRNHKITDEDSLLAASGSLLIFWAVDLSTDDVNPLFMQPTIWDALSVERDQKFRRFNDFIHNDDREKFNNHFKDLANGVSDQWTGEIRILRMAGIYEWHRIVLDMTNNKRIMHCLALNVHKQKEMESKLVETQKLRDLLLSTGKLAIWRFSDDNEPHTPMSSFEPGLMTTVSMNWKFIDEQIHPDYREEFKERLNQAFISNDPMIIDLPIILINNKKEIWVSIRGKARNSSPRQIFGVCIDITELRNALNELQKEQRRAEEADRQKTVFLANMSHEIRTPMNGIFGILDVLALQELNSEQRLLVDSVRASSFQLMKLLDDTLNLSKIETGEIEMNMSIFNLTTIFEPICIATASSAKLNQLKLNVIIDKMFPITLYGNSQLIIQIINNLLSNALKFTKQGSITIKFDWINENNIHENDKYSKMDYLSETCIIEVCDTGIGISKDQQQIIFEKFKQADPSTQRFFGGTGLGLALVNEIVSFLGGKIYVESEVGRGTKFSCHIPMESITVPYSLHFHDDKTHIILVDIEDEIILDSIIDWMTYHQYKVIKFSIPEEILEISKQGKIDSIFVECSNTNDRENWPRIRQVVSRMPPNEQPIVCSLCDAGDPTFFKYSLAKPVLLPHLLNFMNSIRYNTLEKELPSTQVQQNKSVVEEPKKILVVEDNKANQFVMKKILTKIGCSFRIAENGREAITALEEEQFDLVFMDCQMPVLDGIEATKIIRATDKPYSSIPIVALTASAVEGDEQTCRNAGMDAYLAKPVRIQQITNIIQQFDANI
ncbi:ATPase [Tritrichomonas foetus]|uniref:histidine kinase n=1 Tax=Tritrichomonas foetus TaxID=1144522 RepID=A0A1J4JQG6_9EUKA|nr:ATPase [Tritrichomonas foetus]|eukprot:OHT01407.1 ATPase [Tritrichomonas foetus]